MIRKRLLLDSIFFLSIFLFPFWLVVSLGLMLFSFRNPLELVVGGFILDVLYGAPSAGPFGVPFFFTFFFGIAVLIILFVRSSLVFSRAPDTL